MAKKVHSVSNVFDALNKLDPFGSSDMMNSDIGEIKEYIDSGSWILNAALSGSIKKGIPNNKIIQLAGESGCLPKNETIRLYILKSIDNYDREIRNE